MSGTAIPITSLIAPPFPPPPLPRHQPKFTENERQYYVNWINTYPYPCDEAENERLDAMHEAIYTDALEGRLHVASLRPDRLKILDVGFGTGIWALEMKHRYPQAEIAAIDIGNDFPTTDDVNEDIYFYPGVDFTRVSWGFASGTFDFIHSAMLCGGVPDWQVFSRRISSLLKPGGQAEFLELDWEPQCDVQPPAEAAEVAHWWKCMVQASTAAGRSIAYPQNLESVLQGAGCTIVNRRVMQIRHKEDLQNLPEDDMQNKLARWWRFLMATPEFKTLKGMSMALLTRWLQMQPADVSALCNNVTRILNKSTSPFYHNLHVVTVRKRVG